MAEERDTPSLEPPTLFGRKKKPAAPPKPPPAPALPPPEQEAPAAPPTAVPAALPADPPAPTSAGSAAPAPAGPAPGDTPTTIFDDTSEPTPELAPDQAAVTADLPRAPREPREPWLAGAPAALGTGLMVGLLIVGATAGSLRICTKVKGTSSCGDQGFFLLVAILVVAVLLGTALLRLARVPEPGSISFLAVGLLSVVTLLFLVDAIFEWWMVIAIPLVSAATFWLSHWVATTYIDPAT